MGLFRALHKEWRNLILGFVVACSMAPMRGLYGLAWMTTPSAGLALQRRCRATRQFRGSLMTRSQQTDDDSKEVGIISSNFWYTVVRKDQGSTTQKRAGDVAQLPHHRPRARDHVTPQLPPLPCVATMDASGPLPPDSYLQLSSDAKLTSRIQMAWDVSDLSATTNCQLSNEDSREMVSVMQQAIDHGMTTFQIKSRPSTNSILSFNGQPPFAEKRRWAERNLYGALMQETPATVLRDCQLIVPLYLSDVVHVSNQDHRSISSQQQMMIAPNKVRSAVVDRLVSMKGESVDNLQIQFPSTLLGGKTDDDMYYLDLLDALRDLQREGLVRTVSACNMSPRFFQQTRSTGLSSIVESNQHDANLLNPKGLLGASNDLTSATEAKPWTVVSNALAGGWLTDRYMQRNKSNQRAPLEVVLERLSKQDTALWMSCVDASAWGKANSGIGRSGESIWTRYQSSVLKVLYEIALKHRSSMATVVLRWTLQCNDNVASVVVGCRLLPDDSYDWEEQQHQGPRRNRAKQLRSVFSFEFDDEDTERLTAISGSGIRDDGFASKDDLERDIIEGGQRSSTRSGLWVPGTRGRRM